MTSTITGSMPAAAIGDVSDSLSNKMVTVSIDGAQISVPQGTTIVAAARERGIRIPTLCALEGVSNVGSCRVCVVEVEGRPSLVPACNTTVEDGMVVVTNSERVQNERRIAVQLLMANHGLSSTSYCFSCRKNGACELQDIARELDVTETPFLVEHEDLPILADNPFLSFNPNLCIKCQRCVGACNNQAHNHTLQTGKKGLETIINAPFGENWRESGCESCGCCTQACPTGALTLKRRDQYRAWEVTKTLTTCPHCAVGCQMYLVVKDGKIVDVEAANGPSNKGMLCVKGRSASFDFVQAEERLTSPLIKNKESGEFEEATWDEALDLVAARFSEIKEASGPDSLAAFACSRSTNEDVYLLQKMARTAFGTNNVDNCARV